MAQSFRFIVSSAMHGSLPYTSHSHFYTLLMVFDDQDLITKWRSFFCVSKKSRRIKRLQNVYCKGDGKLLV